MLLASLLLVGAGTFLMMKKNNAVAELPTLSMRSRNSSTSSEFLNAQKSVGYYREEIQKHPDAVKNYIQLAQLFLQEARVTGRHHEYIPKAQYLIDQALLREPQNFDANITKATMLMSMHKFQDAKEIAEASIKINPHSAVGYGVLCDAQVELGNYDEAVKACDRMLSIRPDLRSYSRASYLRELHGDVRGAIDAMKMAADAGVSGQENRAWALYNLGKLFLNQGKLDTAAYIFNGVLEERPDYAYAMSGLAQVKRAEGKTAEAVELLSKAAQITPEHLFVEQLADVYRSSGQAQSADGVAKIVLNMFEQHEQGGWNVNREYAMFCASHGINLTEALRRAKKEYESRPNNIDVVETYAWSLYKNGKNAEAVPLIEKAMQLQTNSFGLLQHAAIIYGAAGMPEKAETFFKLAKDENPYMNTMSAERWNSPGAVNKTVASVQ